MIVSFQEVVPADFFGYGIYTQARYSDFRERRCSPVHTPAAGPYHLSYSTAEPELQESQTSISWVLTWKDFPTLFEKTKDRAEAFTVSGQNCNMLILLMLPPEAGRRQLLDLKVRRIIRQLSGEPTQQPIDYNQSSELSSSPFYLAVSPSCTRTPTHSPSASSKVSDASALIITAGIICRFAKCRRLKPAEDQVEREELTQGIKTHHILSLTNKTQKVSS